MQYRFRLKGSAKVSVPIPFVGIPTLTFEPGKIYETSSYEDATRISVSDLFEIVPSDNDPKPAVVEDSVTPTAPEVKSSRRNNKESE